MAWDLLTGKARAAVLSDTDVDALMTASLEMLEGFLDRKIMYAAGTQELVQQEGEGVFFLNYYPVDKTVDIKVGADLLEGSVDHNRGVLYTCQTGGFRSCGNEYLITYAGGYKTLPIDLEIALWNIFDSMVTQFTQVGQNQVAAIDSVTVPDVGTVRFTNQDWPAKGSSGGDAYGPNFLFIVEKYRRILC